MLASLHLTLVVLLNLYCLNCKITSALCSKWSHTPGCASLPHVPDRTGHSCYILSLISCNDGTGVPSARCTGPAGPKLRYSHVVLFSPKPCVAPSFFVSARRPLIAFRLARRNWFRLRRVLCPLQLLRFLSTVLFYRVGSRHGKGMSSK